MGQSNVATLRKRIDRAFGNTERSNFTTTWQKISRFILPNQAGDFLGKTAKGSEKMGGVNDSTAIQANQDLANFWFSTITNPASKLASFQFTDDDLNDNKEAMVWLEQCNNILHSHINQSNFYLQAAQFFPILTALGTSCMFEEVLPRKKDGSFGGLRFNTWDLSGLAFEQGDDGQVNHVYRKFTWTVDQIYSKFPSSIDESMKRDLQNDPAKEYTLYHAIGERDPAKVKIDETGLAPPDKRPYYNITFIKDNGAILQEDGFYEKPVFPTRLSVFGDEVYGRGIGHTAIYTVQSLNMTNEIAFKSRIKAMSPPILSENRNILGSLNLVPDQVTIVRDTNKIKQWPVQGDVSTGNFSVQELRDSVKQMFLIDKILLPPRTETGEQTAFEIQQRLAQLQKVSGGSLNRVNSEWLAPLLIRTFSALYRAREFPPEPEVLADRDLDVITKFVNPFSRQQRLEDVASMTGWVAQVAETAQVTGNPNSLDWVDTDYITKETAEIRSVPPSAVRSSDEVAAIRQQRQAQEQQAQQLEAGVKTADIISKTGMTSNESDRGG